MRTLPFLPFKGLGGGWGYSDRAVEAIRFMVDTNVLLGGFGMFGGRGEYILKIKVSGPFLFWPQNELVLDIIQLIEYQSAIINKSIRK